MKDIYKKWWFWAVLLVIAVSIYASIYGIKVGGVTIGGKKN